MGFVVWLQHPDSAVLVLMEQLEKAVYGDPARVTGVFTNLPAHSSVPSTLREGAIVENRQSTKMSCDGTRFCDL